MSATALAFINVTRRNKPYHVADHCAVHNVPIQRWPRELPSRLRFPGKRQSMSVSRSRVVVKAAPGYTSYISGAVAVEDEAPSGSRAGTAAIGNEARARAS